MRIVIALGGNALLRRREPMTAETQRANVRRAVAALLPLFDAGHQLVITHGNGPQVGLLALQAAAGPTDGAYPLDVLDAESEGMVGYLIEQEVDNALPGGRLVATLLTQILVDRRDPAFRHPTKPIGPVYDKAEATQLAEARGWTMADVGKRLAPRRPLTPAAAGSGGPRHRAARITRRHRHLCRRRRHTGAGTERRHLDRRRGRDRQGPGERAAGAPARRRPPDAAHRCRWRVSRLGLSLGQADQACGARALNPADFAPGSMGPRSKPPSGSRRRLAGPPRSAVWRMPPAFWPAPPAPDRRCHDRPRLSP